MRGIALKCGVVGNAPCVVPIREMLLANLFLCERRFIPPHQSPTAPASPKGKPFCKSLFVLHDKAISKSIYTRPHSSPAATNCLQSSPPKGKPFCKSLFVLHDKAISESIYTRPHPLLRRQTACSFLPLTESLPYAVQP